MALDYYLTIQNLNHDIEPNQVLESLTSVFSLQTNPLSNLLMGVGFFVNVFKDDDDSLFDNAYSDICVAFRIDKFEHYETGMNTMLKMVIWFMSYFKGDMIFSFDNEQTIFQRISAQLRLNDAPEFWVSSKPAIPNWTSAHSGSFNKPQPKSVQSV